MSARLIPFIFSTTDTALIEVTSSLLRIWIDDELLTRPSVTAAVVNGNFATDVASWTDADESGATSSWVSPGYLALLGDGSAYAIRTQTVTVNELSTEHALRVVIARGPVVIRVGSAAGGDQYVNETTLETGTHSLAFTPTGNVYIQLKSRLSRVVHVDSCTVESSGVVTLPSPWAAAADLDMLRIEQSGDTVYVACDGYQQRKIERRGTRPQARSWSIALFRAEDGPFGIENTTPTTLTPSGINGAITLTASAPLFKSTHDGALFSLTSSGQVVTSTLSTSGLATNSIRIVGVSPDRSFTVEISGDANASTVDLQRSYDNSTWVNVGGIYSWTADGIANVDDGFANQLIYYRLMLTTRVAPDSVTLTLRTAQGSVRGIARVTGFTSATSVSAEVLADMGGTTATDIWQEGQWSDANGWPTSVRLHEGRLWWAGQNGVWGSVSDAYASFDETTVGDAGPINRTIGSGPVDTINWMLSLKGLVLGAQGAEYTARASSLDEVLTPTNFNLKVSSTRGSGSVEAVRVDQGGFFVDRSGLRMFELTFDLRSYEYSAAELTKLHPEIGSPGIVRIAVQRLPDTRVHCIRSDGTVAICTVDRTEEVAAWQEFETAGEVEDVVVLPAITGEQDDQVYYLVKRTIQSLDFRFLEKWALEVDCRGGQLNKQADSFVAYSGGPTAIVSAPHLAGMDVVVWADGLDYGTDDSGATWTQRYTLDGWGNVTLPAYVSNYVVGLEYQATFKSGRLGAMGGASPLNRDKRLTSIGVVLHDVHPRGIRYGPTTLTIDQLPRLVDGAPAGDAVTADFEQSMTAFPGNWTTDARLCLIAQAPRPVTVSAVAFDLKRS
jgi:hypothetical protein